MKYLQKQLKEKKGKIVWLASYPKSGNTWFRCFITALFSNTVDLNAMESTDGIFSSRALFDEYSGIDSRLLLDNEVRRMLPEVYVKRAGFSRQLLWVKAHDAYILNDQDNPIFPTDVTHKVIYLVRNPLDVVGSFANHNNTTIPITIDFMNTKEAYLPDLLFGLNINVQLRQLMFSWSKHAESWLNQKNVEVIVVRYEDMLNDGFNTFSQIMKDLEFDVKPEDIKRAIDLSSFSKLKKNEEKRGFKEKNIHSGSFFRSGKSGNYKKELTAEQIKLIQKQHKKVMKRLQYL